MKAVLGVLLAIAIANGFAISPAECGEPAKNTRTTEDNLRIGFKGIYIGSPEPQVREHAKNLHIDIDEPRIPTSITFAGCALDAEPHFFFDKGVFAKDHLSDIR